MKSLVLWSCILGPYVPLRTSSKRKRVANECTLYHLFDNIIVQIDEGYNVSELLTLQIIIVEMENVNETIAQVSLEGL